MGHFGVNLMSAAASALLRPGEVALAYENASMMGAADRTGKAAKAKGVTGFSWNPLLGGVQAEDGYFESKLSGVGAEGEAGSLGAALMAAIGVQGVLLLTTQRLLVLELERQRLLFEVERDALVGARAAPRLGQLGRIELTLRDGSRVRPMLGMIWPRAARRFLRAVRTGRPQS